MPKFDPLEPFYGLGLGNWSNILYFQFGEEFDSLVNLPLLKESEIDFDKFEKDGAFEFGYIIDFAVKIMHLDLNDMTAVDKFNNWVNGRACQFYDIDTEIGIYAYGCGVDEFAWKQSDLDKKLGELKEKYQSHADEMLSKIT